MAGCMQKTQHKQSKRNNKQTAFKKQRIYLYVKFFKIG